MGTSTLPSSATPCAWSSQNRGANVVAFARADLIFTRSKQSRASCASACASCASCAVYVVVYVVVYTFHLQLQCSDMQAQAWQVL